MNNNILYVVDDHKLFCNGLKRILEEDGGFVDVKVFNDAQSVLDALIFKHPDMIIGDISMPGMDGIELLRRVKSISKAIKYLIISTYSSIVYIKDSLSSGADGYLLKESHPDELLNAINAILNGKTYVSPEISAQLYKSSEEYLSLTPREIDILQHIALGLNSHQMAEKLYISFHTVETHRKSLLTKTNCQNSVELSMWGVEKGIVKFKNTGN